MDKYYYEYKDDGDIKYCYPGTQVLVNKLGIHNGQQLSMVEREISIVKAAVLIDTITGNFNLALLTDGRVSKYIVKLVKAAMNFSFCYVIKV